jgi:hypothetical protein
LLRKRHLYIDLLSLTEWFQKKKYGILNAELTTSKYAYFHFGLQALQQ